MENADKRAASDLVDDITGKVREKSTFDALAKMVKESVVETARRAADPYSFLEEIRTNPALRKDLVAILAPELENYSSQTDPEDDPDPAGLDGGDIDFIDARTEAIEYIEGELRTNKPFRERVQALLSENGRPEDDVKEYLEQELRTDPAFRSRVASYLAGDDNHGHDMEERDAHDIVEMIGKNTPLRSRLADYLTEDMKKQMFGKQTTLF